MAGVAWRWMAAAVAAAALMFGGAEAADAVFVVQRVPVAADGESATAAKDAAQASGRRRAMDILLRRITVDSDWAFLPRLSAGQAATADATAAPGGKTPIALNDAMLQNLEAGFEVYDEKGSASTYRAVITYRFKPDAVRRLLRGAAIPFSETQTLPALVLPVLETGGGLFLWESNNPWLAAWRGRSFLNELTPIRAPNGDGADVRLTTARQALSLDPAAMAEIAKRYNVAQIIVAHARLDRSGGDDRLSVRLLNAYKDTATASVPQEGGEEGGVDTVALAAVAADPAAAAKVGDVLASGVWTEPQGHFGALASKAVDSVIARYSAAWKSKTLIDYSREVGLETTAFFQSVEDWARIRAGLNATPLVGGIQVFALSPRGAELRLKVFGEPSRLAVALDAYGVVFWSEDGARWLLATPSQAARLKGDKSLRLRRANFDPSAPTTEDASGEYNDPELAPDSKIDGLNASPQQ